MEQPDAATPQPGQPEATRGDGNQPAELGYAPPDTGLGDSGDSEIAIGVDALTDEQKAKAQEAAADSGDDDGALDVSAIVSDDGDADEATAEADAEADADAEATTPRPTAEADADAAGTAADEAGEDAPQMTDPDAQVAANTGEGA